MLYQQCEASIIGNSKLTEHCMTTAVSASAGQSSWSSRVRCSILTVSVEKSMRGMKKYNVITIHSLCIIVTVSLALLPTSNDSPFFRAQLFGFHVGVCDILQLSAVWSRFDWFWRHRHFLKAAHVLSHPICWSRTRGVRFQEWEQRVWVNHRNVNVGCPGPFCRQKLTAWQTKSCSQHLRLKAGNVWAVNSSAA